MSSWVRLAELPLPTDVESPGVELARLACQRLRIAAADVVDMRIVHRAMDARHRPLRYVYTIELALAPSLAQRLVARRWVEPVVSMHWPELRLAKRPDGPPPIVVGAGPAGLFAALTLAQAGWPPIIIERGKPVETRAKDVSRLYCEGVVDSDSNVCFGEGGAGAFSDGKLRTRVGDPRVRYVMEALVAHGADPDILIDNRPHLGTDRLVVLLRALRQHLQDLGVVFRFGAAFDRIIAAEGAVCSLALRDGETLDASVVVLATGHSAREVWQSLHAMSLPLELRPFAVGFRIEHPQALINELRYGKSPAPDKLPAADYRLTYNDKGETPRGVYSFCMCPGGVVVPTPTHSGELCINGMSHASRAGRYANSALVVTVGAADFSAYTAHGVFSGVMFQCAAEHAAYAQGGDGFCAPAARVTDFLNHRVSTTLPQTSYRRGVVSGDLDALYPSPIGAALRRALQSFDRKMPGFVTDLAMLMGVETRTASPLRLPRGDDLQAVGCRGLYPAGEGMGYGGGIVSAAVDGVRVAEAILTAAGAT